MANLATSRIEFAGYHVARARDAFAHQSILSPAIAVEYEIAGRQAIDPAFHHLRHRAGVARRAFRLLAAALVAPLIRIKGDVDRSCQRLTGSRCRDRRIPECEGGLIRPGRRRPPGECPIARSHITLPMRSYVFWRPITAKSTSGRLKLLILIDRCKLGGRAAELQTRHRLLPN